MKTKYILSSIFTVGVLSLTHKFWLEKFDLYIFFIILILGFFIFLKLTSYIADFKIEKEKSRLDIVFLTIFFVFLFVPMLHIDQSKVSKTENRNLAAWKPLFYDKYKINYKFGKNYNDWYSDRFNGRSFFIGIYDKIHFNLSYKFYKKGVFVLNKQNKWIGNVTVLKQKKTFTQKEIDKTVENIDRLNSLCKKNNIKLYVIIAPLKEEIYSEEIFGTKFNLQDKTIKMKNYIENRTGVPVILAYDEMKSASEKEFVCFKTDHHWTDIVAYLGYKALGKRIKQDFPDIYISNINDFEIYNDNKVRVIPEVIQNGNSYDLMGLNNPKIFDVQYKFYKHKNYEKLKFSKNNIKGGGTIFDYVYDINAPKMYIFGDSFTLNLLQFIPLDFKNTKNVFIPAQYEHANIKLYEKDIVNSHSDILVLCFSRIDRLTTIYKD